MSYNKQNKFLNRKPMIALTSLTLVRLQQLRKLQQFFLYSNTLGCGGHLKGASGTISGKPRYSSCEWIITGGNNQIIEITFSKFQVTEETCTWKDFVLHLNSQYLYCSTLDVAIPLQLPMIKDSFLQSHIVKPINQPSSDPLGIET